MTNALSMEHERRQPIMGILLDPPNAITFAGALSAMFACAMAVMGHYNLALICVLWSHLADSLDGLVARRMRHRQSGMSDVGKAMDALGDFLSAGVFPLIFLASLGEAAPFPVFAGLLICAAGILRLSYFEAFGLSGGSFVGVPLPHNILAFALSYYLGSQIAADHLILLMGAVAVIMSGLHLSSIRFPKMNVTWIVISAVFITAMSALLALQ
ncbi:CDP-alcohol phosphatidyltransferase [Rhizobium laguerreae]|uniref:CDP-alcohol phosphatidyltransferase family protein n=1 Tax=Rhizobium laguerreae TaxID=1076926 RepID=UPI001C9088EE|nr:CDP-alcohol phosphatidyltransferase family protein [Rhizobium laguerreae]MBY3469258.1 CDP-alcohol phosphatidyltransferase [Rhizobium laguerreae]